MNQHHELDGLGWNDGFERPADCQPADTVARVAAVDRDQLLLVDQSGPFRAKLAGSFLHRYQLPQDRPCVGDWVCVEKPTGDGLGTVHARFERRTSLRRKSAGNDIGYQMIGANLDYVVIVQSCHFDFNAKRLERYLVMVKEGGAEPLILLTKTDLVEPAVLAAQLEEIRAAGITAPIVPLSNVTRDGLDVLTRLLVPGKTYCFVGSSGVGKSTLINQLIGSDSLETGSVSETGEGRHTTVRRELVRLPGGALVIDNPGMREFGILAADEGIEISYADVTALAAHCRFPDCRHISEPGCAVRTAVQAGEIGQEHLDNFLKLREESRFNEMSYAEKRKKDRNFGRYIKSVKKNLKDS
jgi:ribosome biogenesis GTPase